MINLFFLYFFIRSYLNSTTPVYSMTSNFDVVNRTEKGFTLITFFRRVGHISLSVAFPTIIYFIFENIQF